MKKWTKETVAPIERKWEEFYRNRFQHDKRVRTTHGVNCTGSCSWEVFVKDGIVWREERSGWLPHPRCRMIFKKGALSTVFGSHGRDHLLRRD